MKKHGIFLLFTLFLVTVVTFAASESSNPFASDEILVEQSAASDATAVAIVEEKAAAQAAAQAVVEVAKEEEAKKEEEKAAAATDANSNGQQSASDPNVFSPPITGIVEVGNSSLNVRTGEWDNIVGSLYTGDRVKIIGKSGSWYKAEINGETRFIHMNYVSTSYKAAGQTPVIYPWAAVGSDAGIAVSQKAIDSCGWGGVFPNEPPATRISSPYGYRTHPVTGQASTFHNGVDLPCVSGSRLNALANGVVTAVGYESGGGNYLKIRYANGYESSYLHLQKSLVKVGDNVSAGEKVALADNAGVYTTGSHLHFTVRYNGSTVDPEKLGIPLIK